MSSADPNSEYAGRDLDRDTRGAETAKADLPAMPSKMPPSGLATTATGLKRPLSSEEAAALAELREKARGAEVICIVRPLANSDGKSEIIVLDKASKEFLDQLSVEQHGQPSRELTSLELPNDRLPQRARSR